jgi:hypothetical protein
MLSSSSASVLHVRHRTRAGTSSTSGRAPSSGVPAAHTSKQKLAASGTTPDSLPIARRTRATLAAPTASQTVRTTFSVIASSRTVTLASVSLGRLPRTGRPFRSEFRVFTRDGQIVCIRGEAEMIRDEDGRPTFIQGIAYDITDSKRAEGSRARARRANEDLARRKGGAAQGNPPPGEEQLAR